MATTKVCAVDGCGKRAKTRGWCGAHYKRVIRHGDPLAGRIDRGSAIQWLSDHCGHSGEECLMWPFAKNAAGYGWVKFSGQSMYASRAMCVLAYGEPPSPEYQAAHLCGKGHEACVNPRHLSWKTQQANNADKELHNTIFRGENHPSAKLDDKTAGAILRALKDGGQTQRKIAEEFGISQQLVCCIKKGRRWGWVNA